MDYGWPPDNIITPIQNQAKKLTLTVREVATTPPLRPLLLLLLRPPHSRNIFHLVVFTGTITSFVQAFDQTSLPVTLTLSHYCLELFFKLLERELKQL